MDRYEESLGVGYTKSTWMRGRHSVHSGGEKAPMKGCTSALTAAFWEQGATQKKKQRAETLPLIWAPYALPGPHLEPPSPNAQRVRHAVIAANVLFSCQHIPSQLVSSHIWNPPVAEEWTAAPPEVGTRGRAGGGSFNACESLPLSHDIVGYASLSRQSSDLAIQHFWERGETMLYRQRLLAFHWSPSNCAKPPGLLRHRNCRKAGSLGAKSIDDGCLASTFSRGMSNFRRTEAFLA